MTTPTRKRQAGAAAVLGTAALVSAFAAPAGADVLSPSFIKPTAGATQINIVGFNDFHGRFLDADLFAATVLQAQQEFGEANSLVISNGDAVGASLFESSIQQDQPTIDVLNTIGVDSWTQGNHEFDQGIDDATGRIASATNGPDLAANVTLEDGSYPFDTHAIFEVNGLKVAVIGAVTEETSALVSPDGIRGVTFGDPVEAVNRVAAELTANNAADVIIASYHEGAPNSDVPLATNEETEVFRHIVQDTAPEVDAIFNAHSHREYAYDAPNGSTTRPVIQAGQYAENIAQVALTVDQTGKVTKSESSVVPTLEAVPAALENDPRIAEVRSIRDAAVAEAEVLGAEVIGTQTGDLSRGKEYEPGTLIVAEDGTTSGGVVTTADNRAEESSLGGIISQSMLESVAATGRDVDAAIMNPGGLRADLLDNDGKITYKEAATVIPFANNLSVVSLKGVDVKNVLEEQWQLTANGEVPSRPYLQLGLSDNFSYVFDSSRPRMDRIVSLTINDEPVKPDETYNLVMPTFLAAGGDNFHSLTNNVGVQDTGLIDLDAFVNWVRSETAASAEGVTPDTKRNGFEIVGLPANNTFVAGETYTLKVAKFNLTSIGFTQNLTISGWLGQMELGSQTVDLATPNEVTFTFTVPENGVSATTETRLAFLATESGAVASLPVIALVLAETPAPTATTEPTPTATTEPTESATAAPTATPTPAASGDSLATTGANETAIFAGIAGALALLVTGGAAMLLRRRAGSDA